MERYGNKFNSIFSELEKTQYFSTKKIIEYQTTHFLNIVKHAYETVPYYKTLFDEHDIRLSTIQSLDDAKCIPILAKNDIRANFNNLISSKFSKKH